MTAPVGPTGLAQRCTGGTHAEGDVAAPSLDRRVGVRAAGFRSTLLMDGRVGVQQLAATASFELHLGPKRTLQVGAGGIIDGALDHAGHTYSLGPGGTVSFGYSHLIVEPDGAVPFVQLAGSVAASGAKTSAGPYWALDVRASVAAGWVLFDRFTPYATVRAFGGPVFWNSMSGGDAYHFQVGAGFVLGLGAGLDLSAEIIPLGEQSISAGLGYSF